MNLLNIYTRLYSFFYINDSINLMFAKLKKLTRKKANQQLPTFLNHFNYSSVKVLDDLIVSLTSFPARIDNVWMVIESIKNQSYLPQKIILWLSKDQFPTEDTIPESLKCRIDNRFEIRMVDGDLKSHKKYFYVFQEFHDKIIITVDDDVFYHPDVIKHLYEDHKKFPLDVITNIASRPLYNNNTIVPYKQWKKVKEKYCTNNLVQIGIGGVLYPPDLNNPILLNEKLILELAPFADDLWLNAIMRLNGISVRKSSFRYLPLGILSKTPTLSSYNRHNFGNDIQLEKLRDYFLKTVNRDLFANSEYYEM